MLVIKFEQLSNGTSSSKIWLIHAYFKQLIVSFGSFRLYVLLWYTCMTRYSFCMSLEKEKILIYDLKDFNTI